MLNEILNQSSKLIRYVVIKCTNSYVSNKSVAVTWQLSELNISPYPPHCSGTGIKIELKSCLSQKMPSNLAYHDAVQRYLKYTFKADVDLFNTI